MLNVINFLKEHKIEDLNELGITVKEYPNCVLLSYSQIDSPKENPIVMECRGLILSNDYKSILCKSFTRFFNYGECVNSQKNFSFENAVVYEKVDGSLVRFWKDNVTGEWNISTRQMAYGEGLTSSNINTFSEAVKKCFYSKEDYNEFCRKLDEYNSRYTYVFEFVSPENRVVKNYGSEYALYFLAYFNNETGEEDTTDGYINLIKSVQKYGNIKFPQKYALKDYESIKNYFSNMEATDEGFVVYDNDSGIRVKIKNPAYLTIAAKRMNGGLTENHIVELIFQNETSEYLTYFNEDAFLIEPYQKAYDKMMEDIHRVWNEVKDFPRDNAHERKEFALKISSCPFSDIIFAMKDGNKISDIFNRKSIRYKIRLISKYKD